MAKSHGTASLVAAVATLCRAVRFLRVAALCRAASLFRAAGLFRAASLLISAALALRGANRMALRLLLGKNVAKLLARTHSAGGPWFFCHKHGRLQCRLCLR